MAVKLSGPIAQLQPQPLHGLWRQSPRINTQGIDKPASLIRRIPRSIQG